MRLALAIFLILTLHFANVLAQPHRGCDTLRTRRVAGLKVQIRLRQKPVSVTEPNHIGIRETAITIKRAEGEPRNGLLGGT